MKKIIPLAIILFISIQTHASHLFGGEISWKCLPTGQYIFTLKVYRDCNGIPFSPPGAITVYSTDTDATHFPSAWSIPLGTATVTDISPSVCPSNCNTGGPGTVQEFIQTSVPVYLSGIPPATGWVFEIDDCCRNILNNITGTGFTIRSVMYPFNNQNTNPCFDSSPYFAERPSVYICTGYTYSYTPLATDDEHDSLSYKWDYPLDQPTSTPPNPFTAPFTPYNAPYSINSPLPGNATLNSLSGEIIMNPALAGNFVSVVKVESFKCGIKTAEIFRDISFTLTTNCTLSNTANINNPPVILPPFQDSLGLYTLYSDTVFAGDSIDFNFYANDFEVGTDASPGNTTLQSVSIEANGSQFGAGYNDPNSGCLLPPCAILNPPPPVSAVGASTTHFHWQTDPIHLGLQYGCAYLPNTYYFLLKANDNYCPAPAYGNGTISITVLPTVPAPMVVNNSGTLSTPVVPGFNYQWYRNRFPVVGATSSSFTPVLNGYYQVRIMDATFNGNYSQGITISTGISDLASEYNVVIYPNPSTGIVTFQLSPQKDSHVSYSLYDVTGRPILSEQISNHGPVVQRTLDLSGYSKDVYYLQLYVDGGVISKKIVLVK